mgnify:CR=1 FL=1
MEIYNKITGDSFNFEDAKRYYRADLIKDYTISDIFDLEDYLNSLDMYGCGTCFFVTSK